MVQAFYVLFRDDDQMKLPYFIVIAGVACGMFAICIPHLSALGVWLGVSTVLTVIYVVIAVVLSIKDGNVSRLISVIAHYSHNNLLISTTNSLTQFHLLILFLKGSYEYVL